MMLGSFERCALRGSRVRVRVRAPLVSFERCALIENLVGVAIESIASRGAP